MTSVTSRVKKTPARPTRNPSGNDGSFFTTEDTEVTEALGNLASPLSGLWLRYNHLSFLVYAIQGFAAPPPPQALGTDRNDDNSEVRFLRVFVFASSR